jgi:hypothetical protein
MSKQRGGGERNEYPARTQADTEGYRTQDERPDYTGGRSPDELPEERPTGAQGQEGADGAQKK